MVLAPQVLQVQLLGGLFPQPEQVAHRMAAHQMANFLGGVFRVVSGALDRLGHGDDVNSIRHDTRYTGI